MNEVRNWNPTPCPRLEANENCARGLPGTVHVEDEELLWHPMPVFYFVCEQVTNKQVVVHVKRYKVPNPVPFLDQARITIRGTDFNEVHVAGNKKTLRQRIYIVLERILKGRGCKETEVTSLNRLPPLPSRVPEDEKDSSLEKYQKQYMKAAEFQIPK